MGQPVKSGLLGQTVGPSAQPKIFPASGFVSDFGDTVHCGNARVSLVERDVRGWPAVEDGVINQLQGELIREVAVSVIEVSFQPNPVQRVDFPIPLHGLGNVSRQIQA